MILCSTRPRSLATRFLNQHAQPWKSRGINEPLTVIDDAMYSRRTPENIQLTTRKHPPQKVEEAVVKDDSCEDMQGFSCQLPSRI